MKSTDKWPVTLQFSTLSESTTNKALTTILVVGIMNRNQVKSMEIRANLQSNLQIDDDNYVIACVLTQDQIDSLYDIFKPLSRSWRGQYQSLAKAFVEAYQEMMHL